MIDYEMKIRSCAICGEVHPFEHFGFQKVNIPRSYCKKCRSTTSYNRHQEKKLTLFPNLYSQCDECCFIWRNASFSECKRCNP